MTQQYIIIKYTLPPTKQEIKLPFTHHQIINLVTHTPFHQSRHLDPLVFFQMNKKFVALKFNEFSESSEIRIKFKHRVPPFKSYWH